MITKSKTETQKIAAKLAKRILNPKPYTLHPRVIALSGTLGSGKTTFVQGFMKAMGVKHHITSPTFIIFRRYPITKNYKLKTKNYSDVYHFDLYRLDKPQDVMKLGFKKIISDKNNIVLIEWPELIKKQLPKNTIWIKFGHGKNKKERIISGRAYFNNSFFNALFK